jgi:hypothetical protein
MASEEELYPLGFPRERVPVVTEMRSAWIVSSLRALRDRGHFDHYRKHLAEEHHAFADAPPAFDWVSIKLIMAHYAAANALELGTQELLEIGGATIARAQGTALDVGLKLAKGAGVTPSTMLAQAHKSWLRNVRGGALGMWKLGPKDVRVEFHGVPFARYPYNRVTMRGLIQSILVPFARSVFVADIHALWNDRTMAYRISWA